MAQAIDQKAGMRQVNTVNNYRHTLQCFRAFLDQHGKKALRLDQLTPRLLRQYEDYLLQVRHVSPNSSSFYMRHLRSVYRQAVIQGLVADRHPFDTVYTGTDKTRKRAISLDQMRLIAHFTDFHTTREHLYHDIFLFLFLAQGMAFVDLAHLRKSDIADDHINYRRQKTGSNINVAISRPLRLLIDKYAALTPGPYLFPVISFTDTKRQTTEARNMLNATNRFLNRVGCQLELSFPLTTYVARHTWATLALANNLPVADISEALGHASERTTRIYLKQLPNPRVMAAANTIADSIV